jgi:hypothetical protein
VYDAFDDELANLRATFRWAIDRHELDLATDIVLAADLAVMTLHFEMIAWAEELAEPARNAGLRRAPRSTPMPPGAS